MANMKNDANKMLAMIVGAVLLLVGVLGFIPAFVPDGRLLGIFEVNAFHNVIHLVTGGVLVGAAFATAAAARMTNMTLGVIYLLVALIGFVAPGVLEAMAIATNMADNFLHLVLGIVLLGVGLTVKSEVSRPLPGTRT